MLQKGIHLAIINVITVLCNTISSERKRVWPRAINPIYDRESWISAGKPEPLRTRSSSECPEVHPFTLLCVLNDFFNIPIIRDKLKLVVTRKRRENIESLLDSPLIDWTDRVDSTMEFFNGKRYDQLEGGLDSEGNFGGFNLPGPASNRYSSNEREGVQANSGSSEDINNYYMEWDCDGDFVHKKNLGIGWNRNSVEHRTWLQEVGTWGNFNSHNFSCVYGSAVEYIRSDPHPQLLSYDNTITNLSKEEKVTYITMFLKFLCTQYDGEEGNSPVDRATWYEVSEFIKFYHDIWTSFSYSDGDEECWVSENITSGPLTHNNFENSTMYEIPGVWHSSEGGKWSQNFETIMKIQTNDWKNSIWKKKYDVYLQRIFQEDGTTLYNMIVEIDLNEEQSINDYEEDTGQEDDDQVVNPTREKVKSLMDCIFKNRTDIPEGLYIEICDRLKDINDSI